MISSMGSSMSHPPNRRNPTLFAFSNRESFRRASHLLLTKLGEQYHTGYGRSLVGGQKSGAHSVVGCAQCKFLHREESMPVLELAFVFGRMLRRKLTLIAACRALAISLSCSNLGLLPSISGNQNCPTAPFICPILPCAGAGALTHCDGSRPTPHTI
jgi:hypothetical protein